MRHDLQPRRSHDAQGRHHEVEGDRGVQPDPPRWTAWCPTCGDSGAPLYIGLHAERKANEWCSEHRMKETA